MTLNTKHHIIGLALTLLSTLTLGASEPVAMLDAGTDGYCGLPGSEDVYMPSLSELLGGPVDDLGEYFATDMMAGEVIDYAKQFLGTRYRRGAKGPSAFDCSGFTSYIFRKFGINLGAASGTQSTEGEAVELADARPGDLMFFSGARAGKRVGHVGMVVDVHDDGSISFIHASTSKGIAIDRYPDGGYYSKRFISVRRVISDDAAEAMAAL